MNKDGYSDAQKAVYNRAYEAAMRTNLNLAGKADKQTFAAAHHAARQAVAAMPVPVDTCDRCGGTGMFVTHVENGQPKGPGGTCYRCAGKGHVTEADKRRNFGYDNNRRITA